MPDYKRDRMAFIIPDIKWAAHRIAEKLKKHIILPFYSIESSPRNTHSNFKTEENMAIPMRDGILLRMNIYRPKSDGKFPAILIRLPYGKDEYYCKTPAIGKFWARKGYVCIVQDVRGKFCSEGEWKPCVNEAKDGYDTIDWIAKQPWCDGNIGMMGESYFGYTTWAAATTEHPNLKCISPSTTAMDIYRVWVYNCGAFCLQTVGVWGIEMNARKYQNSMRLNHWHLPLISIPDKAGLSCEYFKEMLEHQTRDSYWDALNLSQKYSSIKIPVLHVGGWYDVFLRGTIADWIGVKNNSKSVEARENQWLMIGPYDHEFTPEDTKKVGKIGIGEDVENSYYDTLQLFFDYWLKGIDNDFDKSPRIRIFTIGDNEWRYENEWPLARTNFTEYYLHSNGTANSLNGDGRLDTEKPSDEPVDGYEYDPHNPVAITTRIELWKLANYLGNRSRVEKRPDVLLYTSSELDHDIEITGPILLTLYAASSAKDTDFTAALVDVFPDGYAQLIQEGIIRASFRNSDRERSLIEPGRVYEYHIDLFATSYIIRKGHKIRVEVSSSNFDRYDRNLNTGEKINRAAETRKAKQNIHHDSSYPSHITLPIIPR